MALDRWNLSVLFSSEEEFLATLEEFKSLIPLVGDFQGKLSNEEKLAPMAQHRASSRRKSWH